MATHSSVLAWRIPGTGEPGGLLSMASHRVGHNWSDLAAAAAAAEFIKLVSAQLGRSLEAICFWVSSSPTQPHASCKQASKVALVVKNPPANAGESRDAGSIPGSGISSGVGNGNPPQYSCRENSMDSGAWRAAVHGVPKNQTRLSTSCRKEKQCIWHMQ